MLEAVQAGKKAERMAKKIKYQKKKKRIKYRTVSNTVSTTQRQTSVGRGRGYIWNLTGREKRSTTKLKSEGMS